jgi:hypothetical protein
MEPEYSLKYSQEHSSIDRMAIKLSCLCTLTEHHVMKAYWGSVGIVPCILDLGTRWRWVASFTSGPLYPQWKSPWYTFDRRLGGPQSRSGRDGEEKDSQPLLGFEPPINQPVAQRFTSELTQIIDDTDYDFLLTGSTYH